MIFNDDESSTSILAELQRKSDKKFRYTKCTLKTIYKESLLSTESRFHVVAEQEFKADNRLTYNMVLEKKISKWYKKFQSK